MVCATRQHVGKTSVSMALLDCLRKIKGKVRRRRSRSRSLIEISTNNETNTGRVHETCRTDVGRCTTYTFSSSR